MAGASAAYQLDNLSPYAAGAETQERSIRALRTGGRPGEQPSSVLVTVAKMAAILLITVAALSFARIALTSATVSTMIESDTLSGQIEEARSSGIGLEMEQSVLSSTSAVNAAAQRLGMAAPGEVATIALSPDVVAVDETGALSLTDTVKNVAGVSR